MMPTLFFNEGRRAVGIRKRERPSHVLADSRRKGKGRSQSDPTFERKVREGGWNTMPEKRKGSLPPSP